MKVLVVDDHALIRDALRGVLAEVRPGVSVLEAVDCKQALALVEAHTDLELIFLDLGLPDGDGFEVLEDFRTSNPAIGVVVLSATKDRDSVTRALRLGAVGFIPKSGTRPVMLSAIQLILAGGIYVPPEVLGGPEPSQLAAAATQPRAVTKPGSPADLGLTARQIDVLALMLQGKSNKAICRELDIAEQTVKTYVTAILKALSVANRTEVVIAANERGWKPETFRK
ncbi:MAG: response regulator [Hyphomicrobiaceae bacterium]|jgi:DNA-binding NarL/FixJ family response regulator